MDSQGQALRVLLFFFDNVFIDLLASNKTAKTLTHYRPPFQRLSFSFFRFFFLFWKLIVYSVLSVQKSANQRIDSTKSDIV